MGGGENGELLFNGYRVSVLQNSVGDLPGGAVVENLPANAGDMGSSSGLARFHMPRSS